MSDYHVHLHPHAISEDEPPPGPYPRDIVDRYVEAAAARGVTELGFTEHLYRCVESAPIFGRFWESDRMTPPGPLAEMASLIHAERQLSLERYVEVVLEAKSRGLPVKLGLEVDFIPGTEQQVIDLLAPYPWDFLIGSVHWIGGWEFTFSSAPAEFERRGIERAWREYFDLETALCRARMVDVLAHVDCVKKVGLRPPQEVLDELHHQVVAAVVAADLAVEVNSRGLRRKAAEIFPAPSLLAMFRGAGVPITFASDAHEASDAGWGYDVVVGAARAAGYSEYLRFERRERLLTPLPMLEAAARG